MGQKAHPIGNRLGIIRGWDSNWFGGDTFPEKLVEDEKIRAYLKARVTKGGISRVVIERTLNRITMTIHTARPGIIIGKGGAEVDRIKEELKKITGKDVQLNILEIRRPELDAGIVAETVAKQLEARINFRRAIKMAIASTMRMGAEGIVPPGLPDLKTEHRLKPLPVPVHQADKSDRDVENRAREDCEAIEGRLCRTVQDVE